MSAPPDTEDDTVSIPIPQLTWAGSVVPFAVGEPGRAPAVVVSAPDRLLPDHHDTVFAESTLGPVEVRAASVRGLAHRHAGIVRQDDYCVRWTDDDRYLVIAVTDGVSAGRFSHEAAGVAARQSCEVVAGWLRSGAPEEILWDHVLKVVGDAVMTRGRGLLKRRGEHVESLGALELAGWLSTTLTVAVVDLVPDDEGRRPATFLRVGDSTAWIRGLDGGWSSPFAVKNEGEHIASSATSALPHVTGYETSVAMLADGEVLTLMTDGVGDPLGDGHGEVGQFLSGAWEQPPSGLMFAAQVDFARKSFDDDRTVVAVWTGSPSGTAFLGSSTSME